MDKYFEILKFIKRYIYHGYSGVDYNCDSICYDDMIQHIKKQVASGNEFYYCGDACVSTIISIEKQMWGLKSIKRYIPVIAKNLKYSLACI